MGELRTHFFGDRELSFALPTCAFLFPEDGLSDSLVLLQPRRARRDLVENFQHWVRVTLGLVGEVPGSSSERLYLGVPW